MSAPAGDTSTATPSATPGAMPAPGTGATTDTSAPQPAAAGKTDTASAIPMENWRDDPFLPLDYKPKKKTKIKVPKPRIVDFPFISLPGRIVPGRAENVAEQPEPQQPVRRMAGLLLNNRVFAIIETGGESQIVQPGDMLKDQLARVERIEADKVILKTTSKRPRYITIRMAAAARNTSSSSDSTSSNNSRRVGPPGMPVPSRPAL